MDCRWPAHHGARILRHLSPDTRPTPSVRFRLRVDARRIPLESQPLGNRRRISDGCRPDLRPQECLRLSGGGLSKSGRHPSDVTRGGKENDLGSPGIRGRAGVAMRPGDLHGHLPRSVRKRRGDIPVRVLRAGKTRWLSGHAVWISDVFAWRGSPAAWSEGLARVMAVTMVAADPPEPKRLHGLGDDPLVANMITEEGSKLRVAVASANHAVITGPFKRPADQRGLIPDRTSQHGLRRLGRDVDIPQVRQRAGGHRTSDPDFLLQSGQGSILRASMRSFPSCNDPPAGDSGIIRSVWNKGT